MERAFSETVRLGAEERAREVEVIFESGWRVKRTIRGTEITDVRPFLVAEVKLAVGERVERKGVRYVVKEVVESSAGLWTYYLEDAGERANYLD